MATERFAAWVKSTQACVDDCEKEGSVEAGWFFISKAIVYALLTIAIAIHEAAEQKGKK